MVKRVRDEESDAVVAAQQLDAAADAKGDDARKQKALAAVVAAIDPADEQYEAQKELAEGGALAALATLLDDSSAAVSAAAADALLKLTQHSPAVLNRLYLGDNFTLGNPDSVSFNPVQSEVVDLGIISTLVRLQFEGEGRQADAAFAALAALGAYNRGNKLAALHELVRRLIDGDAKAMPAVETLLDGLEFNDDAAVVLDQALGPLLSTLSSGFKEDQRAAASLLGVVLAKRPSIADFLVAEGALTASVQLLLKGDKQTADVAVAAVWGLVKGNQRLLRPEANALGASGPALADPLLDIVLRGKDDLPDLEDGEDEPGADASGSDNSEAALLLLRALARADPEVRAKTRNNAEAQPARCSIM